MQIELNADHAKAAGGILGGLGTLWLAVSSFARRQRAKGERMGRIEATLITHTGQIADLRTDMSVRFDRMETLILGSKP